VRDQDGFDGFGESMHGEKNGRVRVELTLVSVAKAESTALRRVNQFRYLGY